MNWQQEAISLRAKVDRLEEENAWLKSELGDGVIFPPEWRLRPGPSIILACMYRCRVGVCPTDRLTAALEFATGNDGYLSNPVAVYVSMIRKQLGSRFGSKTIESRWGHGYSLAPPLRCAIDDYMAIAGQQTSRWPLQKLTATG